MTNMMKRWALVATLCASTAAMAQTAVDGAVGGTVEDKTGDVVSNASVVVHSNATNAEQKLTTDAQGYFRAIHLQPGRYTVTVTAPGYQTFKSEDVLVEVGLLTDIDAKLPVGSTETTVEVTGESPAINTTSPDFTGQINLKSLEDLPVNNYRWSAYALQTPGVVSDSNGFGLLSFRGQSTLLNNITFDGVDDNQAYYSEERGRTRAGYSTAKASIQEFQVNTSNYTVEYGRSAGGVINAITKSGTNQFHGEGYFLDRDAEWGAKNAFTTLQGVVFKPKDWRKQFGGGIGGPIIKDKLFFFFAYDEFKHNFPGIAVASNTASTDALIRTLPDATLAACSGAGAPTTGSSGKAAVDYGVCNLAAGLNGLYTVSGSASNVNLAAVTPAQYAAAATIWNNSITGSTNPGYLSLTGLTPRTGDQTIWFPKIDWQVNGKNHLTLEVNRLRWTSPAGFQTSTSGIQYGIESFSNDYVRDTYGIAKLDSVLTSNITNEIRYQYGRDFEYDFPQSPTQYEQNTLIKTAGGYTNPNPYPPNVYLGSSFLQFGTYATGMPRIGPDERRWQVADTANWIHGQHSVKFGVDYIHTNDFVESLSYQFGEFSYSGSGTPYSSVTLAPVISYLTDVNKPNGCRGIINGVANTPVPCYNTYMTGQGPLAFEFQTGDYAFFAQDEWKATPRLSLTFGLRYEYEQLPSPYASVVNPALPQTGVFPSDKNNIAPRFGFAYDLFGTGKTVVRGGYGIFNARLINSTIESALTSTGNSTLVNGNAVSQLQINFTPIMPGAPTFPNVTPSATGSVPISNVVYFDHGFKLPQIHQADLTVQQDVGWNTVVGVSWLGSWGRELPNFIDTNLPTPFPMTYTVSATNKPTTGPLSTVNTVHTNVYLKSTASAAACPSGRPNCTYGALTDIISDVNSDYEGLVLQVSHRLTHNLQFQANYTWSHALDWGENNTTFTSTNAPLDASNPRGEYGNSNQNIPNRFVATAVYNTPWHGNKYLKYLLKDFEIAPAYYVQNGLPYTINISGAPTNIGVVNGTTTTTVAAISTSSTINGSGGSARLPSFERNAFSLPRTQVVDLRLSKRFDVTERVKLELLGEAFNLANHVNVTSLNTTGFSAAANTGTTTANVLGTLTGQPTFGAITGANNSNFLYSPRQVQLGLRAQF